MLSKTHEGSPEYQIMGDLGCVGCINVLIFPSIRCLGLE